MVISIMIKGNLTAIKYFKELQTIQIYKKRASFDYGKPYLGDNFILEFLTE